MQADWGWTVVGQWLKTMCVLMLAVLWLAGTGVRADNMAAMPCVSHECSDMATMANMGSMSHVMVGTSNSAPNDVKYCANAVCCASLMAVLSLLVIALFLSVNRVYSALRERFVSYVKTSLWRPPQNTLFSPIFESHY